MLKKVLILGAIAGAGYYFFGNKDTGSATTTDSSQLSEIDSILKQYDGYLTVDKDGYWFLVKGGKLYSPENEAAFYAWQNSHPNMTNGTPIQVSVWENYGQDYYGGSFNATT